jgi:hypothetical protein
VNAMVVAALAVPVIAIPAQTIREVTSKVTIAGSLENDSRPVGRLSRYEETGGTVVVTTFVTGG